MSSAGPLYWYAVDPTAEAAVPPADMYAAKLSAVSADGFGTLLDAATGPANASASAAELAVPLLLSPADTSTSSRVSMVTDRCTPPVAAAVDPFFFVTLGCPSFFEPFSVTRLDTSWQFEASTVGQS